MRSPDVEPGLCLSTLIQPVMLPLCIVRIDVPGQVIGMAEMPTVFVERRRRYGVVGEIDRPPESLDLGDDRAAFSLVRKAGGIPPEGEGVGVSGHQAS